MKQVRAHQVKPGDKVEVFSVEYFIRYIRYRGVEIEFSLQPATEPLSPFTCNDVIFMTVQSSLMVDVVGPESD
ncbi:hypothetical protein SRABI106_04438 [Rahnella aquatilis]|nr:hypothetical protein SRABI106_04438 [Rahnella aquatilis]